MTDMPTVPGVVETTASATAAGSARPARPLSRWARRIAPALARWIRRASAWARRGVSLLASLLRWTALSLAKELVKEAMGELILQSIKELIW